MKILFHPLRFYLLIFYRGSPSFSDGGIPKSMFPYWDFRIADFNPKSRADSSTAMNFKTAISKILRLLLVVNQKFLLLLFSRVHAPLLEKHKIHSKFLAPFSDNTPDTVLCFPGDRKTIAVVILPSICPNVKPAFTCLTVCIIIIWFWKSRDFFDFEFC